MPTFFGRFNLHQGLHPCHLTVMDVIVDIRAHAAFARKVTAISNH